MKFCTNCGRKISEDSKFCQFCGKKVYKRTQYQQEPYRKVYTPEKELSYYEEPIEMEKSKKREYEVPTFQHSKSSEDSKNNALQVSVVDVYSLLLIIFGLFFILLSFIILVV